MEERDENLRTEYAAVASYYGTVITFRFTTVGFFLAAAALIINSNMTIGTTFLLLVFSIGAWIIELRNRAIFRALLDRAIEIEYDWGFKDDNQFKPFFRRMIRISIWEEMRQKTGKDPCEKFAPDKVKVFIWEFCPPYKLITHSFGLDLIYGVVLLFALLKELELIFT